MAAIEKMCEISGEYCGWNMYAWKQNSIQVHPRFRPLFKGREYTLILTPDVDHEAYRNEARAQHARFGWKFQPQFYPRRWQFVLTAEGLGVFTGSITDLRQWRRKMRRLLGVRRLQIVTWRLDSQAFWRAVENLEATYGTSQSHALRMGVLGSTAAAA